MIGVNTESTSAKSHHILSKNRKKSPEHPLSSCRFAHLSKNTTTTSPHRQKPPSGNLVSLKFVRQSINYAYIHAFRVLVFMNSCPLPVFMSYSVFMSNADPPRFEYSNSIPVNTVNIPADFYTVHQISCSCNANSVTMT